MANLKVIVLDIHPMDSWKCVEEELIGETMIGQILNQEENIPPGYVSFFGRNENKNSFGGALPMGFFFFAIKIKEI